MKSSRVIASGSGTRDCMLMSFLRERLAGHGVDVSLSDEVGLPAAYYKEAINFAILRWFCGEEKHCE